MNLKVWGYKLEFEEAEYVKLVQYTKAQVEHKIHVRSWQDLGMILQMI